MKSFLQKSSITFEFIIVIAIAFGLFTLSSFLSLQGNNREVTMTDGALLQTVAIEIVLGGVLLLYLKLRGWKWDDFNLRLTWQSTIDGCVLLFCTFLVVTFSLALASLFIDLKVMDTVKLQARAGVWVVLALSFVNAIYEEVFVAAYVINTLEKYQGALIAVFSSALIRMSYHVYQGPPAVILILPIGFLYGYVYWRWKKLWPVILAHALVDIISLSSRP